ncbi:AraC family transcriptional regulator ligand-binding domain-containing protein [Nocardioides zeae]|uniref:AraC family transcriptional regulator ligand-binding domain-containing protein n=1 Tax=Nocardioides imazamoxiresistens TaxID=3231893 RepID=A0ABU3PRR1_9ACTN|nr:AraC family transcriptional regulator ligand-binding domain-containing protein [Nocardioides zeae]MDT9591920.1 AraC family transcriptional regulator ligand-binding domain-containing protein [Nocardioides zeae]
MGHIRSACLRGLRATVAELGGDADQLARAAGVPVEALDSDDVLITERAAATVLDLAAATLDCPDLGLRVASRQDITMLGSLAVAIQHSPTLGDAMECTTRYLFVHSRSLSLTVGEDPYPERGVAALLYGPSGPDGPVQGSDSGLAFVHRTISYLAGGPYGLRSVELPYRPAAPVAVHEAFYGAPVRVARDVPAAVLRVPRHLMHHTLGAVNENLRRLALAFLAEQAPAVVSTVTPQVRAAVQESLGTRPVEVPAVAALLSLHPRTLQRRLEAEGTTFGEVVDDVRRRTARRLLTTTDLSIGQVAHLVGFAEQSALSRAARRWWDSTPRAVRQGAAQSSRRRSR